MMLSPVYLFYCSHLLTMLCLVRTRSLETIFTVYSLYIRTFVNLVPYSYDHSLLTGYMIRARSNKQSQLFLIVVHISGQPSDRSHLIRSVGIFPLDLTQGLSIQPSAYVTTYCTCHCFFQFDRFRRLCLSSADSRGMAVYSTLTVWLSMH